MSTTCTQGISGSITPPTENLLTNSDESATMVPATVPNASPFKLKVEDAEMLLQSDGFAILRQHLAEQYKYE